MKIITAVLSCLPNTSTPRPSANWWNCSESIAIRDIVLLVRQASPVKCLGDFRWYAGCGNTGWWICLALWREWHLSREAASWRAADERSSPTPVSSDVWNLREYTIYRVGHERVARLPFCTCPCYCINFCTYAMLRTGATFSWPTLYMKILQTNAFVQPHQKCDLLIQIPRVCYSLYILHTEYITLIYTGESRVWLIGMASEFLTDFGKIL